MFGKLVYVDVLGLNVTLVLSKNVRRPLLPEGGGGMPADSLLFQSVPTLATYKRAKHDVLYILPRLKPVYFLIQWNPPNVGTG